MTKGQDEAVALDAFVDELRRQIEAGAADMAGNRIRYDPVSVAWCLIAMRDRILDLERRLDARGD